MTFEDGPPLELHDDDAVRAWFRDHRGCTCRPEISRLKERMHTVDLEYIDAHHQGFCPLFRLESA